MESSFSLVLERKPNIQHTRCQRLRRWAVWMGRSDKMKAPYPLVQIQGALAVQKRGGSERGRDGGRDTEIDGEGGAREKERERETLVRTLQTPAASL